MLLFHNNTTMDSNTNMLLVNAAKYFPEVNMPSIREALEHMDPQKANMILAQDYKDPTIALIISAIIGAYGIDRFYIGDTMMGILKLLTAGGCGIWWIIDIFLIMGATKEKNYQKFVQSASYM